MWGLSGVLLMRFDWDGIDMANFFWRSSFIKLAKPNGIITLNGIDLFEIYYLKLFEIYYCKTKNKT